VPTSERRNVRRAPRRWGGSRRTTTRLGAALLGGAALAAAIGPGCGARTGLDAPEATLPAIPRSDAFCATADYRSGSTDTSLLLVLDESGSMIQDGKWDQVAAAIGAFVSEPSTAGLAMGITYFPRHESCDVATYATPAVPVALLPGNAAAIEGSLAAQTLDGDTPTLPVLTGSIEYARALALADPSRSVVIALATDGAPNVCGSTTQRVADVAREGATSEPQVLTFVIGVLTGYVDALERIAEAGGTGRPIFLHDAQSSAQELVSALRRLRDAQKECRFVVPATGSGQASATDLAASYVLRPGEARVDVPLAPDIGACGAKGGFYVDDPAAPTSIVLCPATCAAVHASAASRVSVIAGCGAGVHDAGPAPSADGGACAGAVDFQCVTSCGAPDSILPACVGGEWVCPAGTRSEDECTSCPPAPHGCCKADGTFAEAACLNGAWLCAPGTTLFGSPGCAPPGVCTRTLPCPLGQVCAFADYACGATSVLGRCVPPPAACDPGAPACGCDGAVYPSRCAATSSGHDVSLGGCSPPAGTFACGPLFCRAADQICKKTTNLTMSVAPNEFACVDATPACPSGCGCHACEPCPAGMACKESCSIGGAGERYLTCTEL
jgi:Mg-chelatase subunit ChlD